MTNKLFIGILAACILAVSAVTTEAAGAKKAAVGKAVNFVKKTVNDAANTVWNNKGAIAVGTAAAVAVTNPEPVIAGTTAVGTGRTVNSVHPTAIGTILVCLLIAALTLIGIRSLWQRLKDWCKILPLLIVGIILLGCGIVEAGTLDAVQSLPEIQCGGIKPPWWDALGWMILVLTILLL
jgi:hypothetical protein